MKNFSEKELKEKFEYIENKIENEGIGFYLLDYTDSSAMPDKKSKEFFEKARRAILDFQDYISEKK